MDIGISTVLAQDEPGFFDNRWPEGFRFPFGEWIKELVFWMVNNPVSAWIGEAVEWPFEQLFELILSEKVGRTSIETVPWLWLVAGFFLVGSIVRNTRVGLSCAAMLSVCGFLGGEYWGETARTIGMIIVAVTFCAIVGIPLGILSGRVDAVWSVVRPTLDAMQVIHPFVFMLPFIFFFGLGNISATMVTMVFALPPIVRLTNLGIRQVPADVVEASRAYGATELKVLTGVQLPLARPAIMTGLNQTLLLAFSMLGIAALMGAGGLGRLLYRAINNLNLGLAASAGLAFFMLAVALDRISQSEDQDGVSLLTHLRQAWSHRKDPAELLAAKAAAGTPTDESVPDEVAASVEAGERLGLSLGLVGGVLAVVGAVITWGSNAGRLSSWARFADENANGELQGLSFNGVSASGGSFFGLFVAALAGFGLLCAARPLLGSSPALARTLARGQSMLLAGIAAVVVLMWTLNLFGFGLGPLSRIGLGLFGLCLVLVLAEIVVTGSPRLGADGLLMSAFGVVAGAGGYLLINTSPFVVGYSHGPGAFVSLLGGGLMLGGGAIAILRAPYGPRRPLPTTNGRGQVALLVLALLVVIGSAVGVGSAENRTEYGWLFDTRAESVERSADTPDRLTIVHTGVNEQGPGLGWVVMSLSAAAVVVGLAASGATSRDEQLRWKASTVLSGLGLSIMVITAAFTLSLVRVANGLDAIAGVGAFMTFLMGFMTFMSGRSLVAEFRRTMTYAPWADPTTTDSIASPELREPATTPATVPVAP
jgi:glycine betaine/proline transport system permease protein